MAEAKAGKNVGKEAEGAFVISRTFDAPRDLVFKAWTEADRLAQWFGPPGATATPARLDLRPGGDFHYSMGTPDGKRMWGRWVFREVVPPERLVFSFSFSDEDGGVTRHPFSPDWPAEVLSTVTFTEEAGRTTLTMRGVPVNPTEAECHAFEAEHESMQKGWAGTLDQLAAFLAKG
jgi:uncharacterized protein YndB with AHSA1/START domain